MQSGHNVRSTVFIEARAMYRADGPAEPVVLERRVVEQLEATARSQRTTLFPALLAIFYAQIYRTTGQTRVAVASLLANRARAEIRDTVGYFVNMVLLPGTIDPAAPFADAVRSARTTVLGSLMHQELPCQLLPPGAVAAPAGLRADEIVFQFHELEPLPQLHGLEVEDVRLLRARRRFPLELFVARGETGATVLVFYDDERFDPAFVSEFTEGFGELAAAVAADPETPVRAVS